MGFVSISSAPIKILIGVTFFYDFNGKITVPRFRLSVITSGVDRLGTLGILDIPDTPGCCHSWKKLLLSDKTREKKKTAVAPTCDEQEEEQCQEFHFAGMQNRMVISVM